MPTITTSPAGSDTGLDAPPSPSALIFFDKADGYIALKSRLDDGIIVDWTDVGACTIQIHFLVPDAGKNLPFTAGYTRTVGLTILRSLYQDWPVESRAGDSTQPTFLEMGGITLAPSEKSDLAAMYQRYILTLPLRLYQEIFPDYPVQVEEGYEYSGYSGNPPVFVQRSPRYSATYLISDFARTIEYDF